MATRLSPRPRWICGRHVNLAVTRVLPLENAMESAVLFAAALASREANQDPIDLAFLAAAEVYHFFDSVTVICPLPPAARGSGLRQNRAFSQKAPGLGEEGC